MVALLGYEQRINDGWQQTRIIAYTIACTVTDKEDRGEIYEMFPLPGDPTPKEREEAQRLMYDNMVAESKRVTEMVRKQINMSKN